MKGDKVTDDKGKPGTCLSPCHLVHLSSAVTCPKVPTTATRAAGSSASILARSPS